MTAPKRTAFYKWWLPIWAALLPAFMAAGQAIVYVNQNATGTIHDGTSWAHAYKNLSDALGNMDHALSFTPISAVNVGEGTITFPGTGHGLTNGEPVYYDTGEGRATNAIGGLNDGSIYYAIVVNQQTIKLAASAGGNAVDLTYGYGTNHTLTFVQDGDETGTVTFNPDQAISLNQPYQLNGVPGLQWSDDGFEVEYSSNGGTDLPNLVSGNDYYLNLPNSPATTPLKLSANSLSYQLVQSGLNSLFVDVASNLVNWNATHYLVPCDPRVAGATAANPVQVWVAAGTYTPTAGTNQEATFLLHSYVSIFGGFRGNEASLYSRQSGVLTVLSGDIGLAMTNGINANLTASGLVSFQFDSGDPGFQDNSYNVIQGRQATGVLLDSLVIANGNAGYTNISTTDVSAMAMPAPTDTNADPDSDSLGLPSLEVDPRVAGGGIFFRNVYDRSATSTDLALNRCTVIDNFAGGYGGGMAVREANVSLSECGFYGNSAVLDGGAIWGQDQNATIADSGFGRNSSGLNGGAIDLETYPSFKTIFPPDQLSGATPINALAYLGAHPISLQQFLSGDITATKMVCNVAAVGVAEDAALLAGKEFYYGKSLLLKTLPSLPWEKASTAAQAAVAEGENANLAGAGAAIGSVYGWVTVAVTIGDLFSDIDPNSTSSKDWHVFSDNFNKYVTPQGWLALLAGWYEDL